METNGNAPLRAFVYGSLKRGYRNHASYCQGYESFRPATVIGRLYRQADGYPMLVVPPASILAMGTSDYQHDLQQLAQFADAIARQELPTSGSLVSDASNEEWADIRGEVYQWPAGHAESTHILRRLDRLEDFYPDQESTAAQASLYHRVIVLARHAERVEPVWTFVAPAGNLPPGCSPMGRSWP